MKEQGRYINKILMQIHKECWEQFTDTRFKGQLNQYYIKLSIMNNVFSYIRTKFNSAAEWVSDNRPQIVSKVNHVGISLIGIAAASSYLGNESIPETITLFSMTAMSISLSSLLFWSMSTECNIFRVETTKRNALALLDITLTAVITCLAGNLILGVGEPLNGIPFKMLLLAMKIILLKNSPRIFETRQAEPTLEELLQLARRAILRDTAG